MDDRLSPQQQQTRHTRLELRARGLRLLHVEPLDARTYEAIAKGRIP